MARRHQTIREAPGSTWVAEERFSVSHADLFSLTDSQRDRCPQVNFARTQEYCDAVGYVLFAGSSEQRLTSLCSDYFEVSTAR